jgi:DNA-binding helix-hairpin-helix protein with protein kinase domain
MQMDAELDAVKGVFGSRAETLKRRLRELDRDEREASARLLSSAQERHVRRRLRRAGILGSRIPGVPLHIRGRLWTMGVRNTAHVTERAPVLAGLPSPQVTAVLLWRVEVESAAKAGVPRSVPEYRRRPIAEVAGRQRNRLERSLDHTRAQDSALRSHIERRYQRQVSALEARLEAEAARLEAERASLDRKIDAVRQEEPVHARRLAEAERSLEPFRHIRLSRFMRFLLLP